MEINEADRLIILDELRIRLADAEKANASIKTAGWTGTGVVGFEIQRIKEIIAKLEDGV